MPPKPLTALLAALPADAIQGSPPASDPLIHALRLDSRQVTPGDLFVALPGGSTDGQRYLEDARRRGAAAIIGHEAVSEGRAPSVPYLWTPEPRRTLALLAAALADFPARQLTMIGVTGTDGKTTTATLIFHILRAAGIKVGMINTLSAVIGEQTLDTGFHVTTPEAPEVQTYLAQMVAAGLTHVVLEATSHGLAQERVTGCDFDLGVVTNITHEHLDFHGSYEAYRAAKARLFTSLSASQPKPFAPRYAILNADDASYPFLRELTQVPQISYGLRTPADVTAEDISAGPDGMTFRVLGPGFTLPVETRLLGDFNVANILAALAATVVALKAPLATATAGLAALPQVSGRMERIEMGQPFTALVDFAHTPNALRRALEAARALTQGRVIVVFGSAGLRDREKRRLMAETATQWADAAILTAEDPRTEDLAAILDEMAAGARAQGGSEGRTFWRIPDRGAALRFAVRQARPGDLVIACGKGHEQSMCFGETEYPWDDRVALRAALAAVLHLPGPAMPYLPTQAAPPDA